jgi:hypothetical protein
VSRAVIFVELPRECKQVEIVERIIQAGISAAGREMHR